LAVPALDPACSCDAISQSVYGVVEDDEVLVRVLTDKHYRGTKIHNSAFRLTDIMSEGVSLVRLGMVDVVEFQAVADNIRQAGGATSVRGAMALQAKLLRELKWDNGDRQLCVFDDPVINDPDLRDNPAHCMAVSPVTIQPEDAQEVRDHLLTIFSEARYLSDLWQTAHT